MNTAAVKRIAIFPAIGIARIGNSDSFFLASDIPGQAPEPAGCFKDEKNGFKKQVSLFRVYAMDDNNQALFEITSESATIEWRVHVANKKSAWYQFNNALDLGKESIPSTRRNGAVAGKDREQLIIDSGVYTITGTNKSGTEFQMNKGTFFGKPVSLGEIRTDDKGRLMVFGGNGISSSVRGLPAITFANNDGWHDDISDGTVRALVSFDGKVMEADPAVVVCAPPNFAPGLFPVVTMLDVVEDLYIREGWMKKKQSLFFYKDIYPTLQRLSSTGWVNEGFFMLFGTNSPADFNNPAFIKMLSNPDEAYKKDRTRVFDLFRDSNATVYEPVKFPPHYGDLFGDYESLPHVDLGVTATQYERLRNWADGKFVTDVPEPAPRFENLTPPQQVAALLRAPLEECLGGPFHPGIELTWPLRQIKMWKEPFRLKILDEEQKIQDDYGPLITGAIALADGGPLDGTVPGSLTRWLGVPWQTDEASCLAGYDQTLYLPLPSFWSVRVPNTVLSDDSFNRITSTSLNTGQKLKHFSYRVDWLRDFTTNYVPRINLMVASWYNLGIVNKKSIAESSDYLPQIVWVETGRKGPEGEDPSFMQVLLAEDEMKTIAAHDHLQFFEGVQPVEEPAPRQSKPLRRHEL